MLGLESVEPVKLLEKMIYSCQTLHTHSDRPCIFHNKISSLLGFFACLFFILARLGKALPTVL